MLSYVTFPSHPKGKATYSDIGGPVGHLAYLEPFAGNSMHAEWEGDLYVVYSYSTAIAVYNKHTHELKLNTQKYSTTTSHHQGLVNAWTGYRDGVKELTEVPIGRLLFAA